MDSYEWSLDEEFRSVWGQKIRALQRPLTLTQLALDDDLTPFFQLPALYRLSIDRGRQTAHTGILEKLLLNNDELCLTISHAPESRSETVIKKPRGKLTVWRVDDQLDMLQACIEETTSPQVTLYMQVGGEKTLSLFAAHDDLPDSTADIEKAKMLYAAGQQ